MIRRAGIVVVLMLVSATPLWAQSRLWHRLETDVWVVPYAGFALASGSHQTVGIHAVWPPEGRLTLAGRYASRWDADGLRSDALSVDLVGLVVGGGQDSTSATVMGIGVGGFSATLGWTYWREHYAAAGMRAMWPFFEPAGGHSLVQGWFDLRYLAPLDDPTGKGLIWAELVLAFVLPLDLLPR